MKTPEQCWADFIVLLNERQPIRGEKDKKTGKYQTIPHQNFLGSISAYRKLFMEANKINDLVKHPDMILSAPIGTTLLVNGMQMELRGQQDAKVYLSAPDDSDPDNLYPYKHVRSSNAEDNNAALFTREELHALIESGEFVIR